MVLDCYDKANEKYIGLLRSLVDFQLSLQTHD